MLIPDKTAPGLGEGEKNILRKLCSFFKLKTCIAGHKNDCRESVLLKKEERLFLNSI
jgi:hypothetical protein